MESAEPDLSTFHPKTKEITLFVSNLSEDVWQFIESFNDYAAKTAEIWENAILADQHLLSNADENNFIFISPRQIDPEFVKYFQELFEIDNLLILTPEKHTGQTSRDLMNDTKLFSKLVELLKGFSQVNLKSYSSSYQFFDLKNKLIESGLNVYTPEAPDDPSAWTVNFFGSKGGIRQLAQKSAAVEPDFMVPDGLICVGIFEASKIAAHKYIKEDGVVLKTNKGHSGLGVLIYREGDLPANYEECQKAIYNVLKKDQYWDKFPIIVEDLVNVNPAVGGGFPNTEFRIKRNGEIELLYYGGLLVTKDGVFQGMEIGNEVINDRTLAQIVDFGYYIGEEYSKEGYRGYYDVDMMAAKNNNIYVSESNVRRTGATHVYKTAVALLDKDFMDDTYIVSNNLRNYKNDQIYNFKTLLDSCSDLLYNKLRREGVVFCSSGSLRQNQCGYIVIAENKARCTKLLEELEKRVGLE